MTVPISNFVIICLNEFSQFLPASEHCAHRSAGQRAAEESETQESVR